MIRRAAWVKAWKAHHTLAHGVVWTHRTYRQPETKSAEVSWRKQERGVQEEEIYECKRFNYLSKKNERRGWETKTKGNKAGKQQSSMLKLTSPSCQHNLWTVCGTWREIWRSNTRSDCAVIELNDRLTHTGGGLRSEARLALAYKAPRSVHTHVSQLSATLLLIAAFVHICSGAKPNKQKCIWLSCDKDTEGHWMVSLHTSLSRSSFFCLSLCKTCFCALLSYLYQYCSFYN